MGTEQTPNQPQPFARSYDLSGEAATPINPNQTIGASPDPRKLEELTKFIINHTN